MSDKSQISKEEDGLLSKHYKYWKSIIDPKRCIICKTQHGKVYLINEEPNPKPPIHLCCRCSIQIMEALLPGKATKKGISGADWWLVNFFTLPDYYITEDEALSYGWIPKSGNLASVAPGKMVTMGVYKNRNGHLPSALGREWFEADIDYDYGYRGTARIVFSNDGLIFVTFDHYNTFIEIVTEEDSE